MSPNINITNGNSAEIINQRMAHEADIDSTNVSEFIVYTDADIRIGTRADKEFLRDGLPILADSYLWDFDPRGEPIYAYADGADANVYVQAQKFTFSEG
jgi:hypothetical protein